MSDGTQSEMTVSDLVDLLYAAGLGVASSVQIYKDGSGHFSNGKSTEYTFDNISRVRLSDDGFLVQVLRERKTR